MAESPTNSPFVAELPSLDTHLPEIMNLLDERGLESRHHHQVSAGIGHFGREVQAAYLHASVQGALSMKDSLACMTQLRILDSKLQRFLGDVTCQSGTTWGLYCGSISFAIEYSPSTMSLKVKTNLPQRLVRPSWICSTPARL